MKYSVLLLYPDYLNDDGLETYFAHVEGDSWNDAVKAAQIEAAEANNCAPAEADDFAELITFPGHIEACPVVEVDKGTLTYEAAAAAQAGAQLPVEELRPDLARIAATANDFLPAEDPESILADRDALLSAAKDVLARWGNGNMSEAMQELARVVELAEQTEGA